MCEYMNRLIGFEYWVLCLVMCEGKAKRANRNLKEHRIYVNIFPYVKILRFFFLCFFVWLWLLWKIVAWLCFNLLLLLVKLSHFVVLLLLFLILFLILLGCYERCLFFFFFFFLNWFWLNVDHTSTFFRFSSSFIFVSVTKK